MTQAQHPTFNEIRTYMDYVNIDLGRSLEEVLIDFRVVCRVYNRRTGNFKACGWQVRLQYGSAFSARNIPFVIFDRDLARSKLT